MDDQNNNYEKHKMDLTILSFDFLINKCISAEHPCTNQ